MSKLLLFTVHDSKSECFLPPVAFRSLGEASRSFEEACRDKETQFFKYPSDFTFIEIGSFDQSTGKISVNEIHKIIHNASEFKE